MNTQAQITDITSPTEWVNFVLSVVGIERLQILGVGLAVTFALVYVGKLVWRIFRPGHTNVSGVRLWAVTAGAIAGLLVAQAVNPSTGWRAVLAYCILLGPLSMVVHHILMWLAKSNTGAKYLPWLYPVVKGSTLRKQQIPWDGHVERRRGRL